MPLPSASRPSFPTENGAEGSLQATRERRSLSLSVTRRTMLQNAAATLAAPVLLCTSTASARSASRLLNVSKTSTSSDATLTIATNRTPIDLDPHSAYDLGSMAALHGQFETLIQVEPGTSDQLSPLIAKSWESNEDKSLWIFHLDERVTFQDGTPCDSLAVRLSFERQLALGLAPATIIGRFIQDASQVTTPDANTVVFDLGLPQPRFDAAVASPSGGPIVNAALARTHEVDGDWGHAWAQSSNDGLGTGPYRVIGFDIQEKTVLERHEDYWQGWTGHHFDSVVLRNVPEAETRRELIESGDAGAAANISPEVLSALEKNPDLVVSHPYNLTVVYIMLTATGPLETAGARQAVCYAFPYDLVVSGVYEGYAKRAKGPCAELCRGFGPMTFVYDTDLEKAKSLLDRAGVAPGSSLRMLVPVSSPWAETLAELLRANLDKIGLKLDTQLADTATLVALYTGDMPKEERPHLMPTFWSPDYNDGWNHLWPQVSSKAFKVGNAGYYSNALVDTLLDQAREAIDETTYQTALSQIQQIVTYDDPAAIYVVQPQYPIVLQKHIGGFVPNLITGELLDFYALYSQ